MRQEVGEEQPLRLSNIQVTAGVRTAFPGLEVDRPQECLLVEHAFAERKHEGVKVRGSFDKPGHILDRPVQVQPFVNELVGEGLVDRRLVERVSGVHGHHEGRRVSRSVATSVRVGTQEHPVRVCRGVERLGHHLVRPAQPRREGLHVDTWRRQPPDRDPAVTVMTVRQVATHDIGVAQELQPRTHQFAITPYPLTQAGNSHPGVGGTVAPGRRVPTQLKREVLRSWGKNNEALQSSGKTAILPAKLERRGRGPWQMGNGLRQVRHLDRAGCRALDAPTALLAILPLDQARDERDGSKLVYGRHGLAIDLECGRPGNRHRQLSQ